MKVNVEARVREENVDGERAEALKSSNYTTTDPGSATHSHSAPLSTLCTRKAERNPLLSSVDVCKDVGTYYVVSTLCRALDS